MADSSAFLALCEALQAKTSLDRLESRGTVRLALRQAGLEARNVTASQLVVVTRRLLGEELASRGVDPTILDVLCEMLEGMADTEAPVEGPESLLDRLR